MSIFEHDRKTVRGRDFWTRTHTSQSGVPYLTYQAIGPGNQEGPKDWDVIRSSDGRAWHLTAKAAAAALDERLAVVARRAEIKADLEASEARLVAAADARFEAQQAREMAGICEDCMQVCRNTCPSRQMVALSSRMRGYE